MFFISSSFFIVRRPQFVSSFCYLILSYIPHDVPPYLVKSRCLSLILPIAVLRSLAEVFEIIIYDKLYLVPTNTSLMSSMASWVRDPLWLIFALFRTLQHSQKNQAITIFWWRSLDLWDSGLSSYVFHAISGVLQRSHLDPLFFILVVEDVDTVLKFCNYFLFHTDSLKMLRIIWSCFDCIGLQNDFNRLPDWWSSNGLHLNTKEFSITSSSRKKVTIRHEYKIVNEDLLRVMGLRDLGLLFDEKLSYIDQVSKAIHKSLRSLGSRH